MFFALGHIPHVIRRLSNIEENLPTEDQLQSIAYNLITIQHTQKLRTGDLVAGKIGQHAALNPISPEDQFRISKLAVDEDDYYYAAQWLKHLTGSEKLAEMKREVHGFNATNVLGMLASAYFRVSGLLPPCGEEFLFHKCHFWGYRFIDFGYFFPLFSFKKFLRMTTQSLQK